MRRDYNPHRVPRRGWRRGQDDRGKRCVGPAGKALLAAGIFVGLFGVNMGIAWLLGKGSVYLSGFGAALGTAYIAWTTKLKLSGREE